MSKTKYLDIIPTTIGYEDAYAGITNYNYSPPLRGSWSRCDSDWDAMGNEEIEWELLDETGLALHPRNGELTDEEEERIQTEISEYMQEHADDNCDYEPW